MKFWVDDLRPPPNDTWRWFITSSEAITALQLAYFYNMTIDEMSLDHDLGGNDTTRPVVLWMCQERFWPKVVKVHSANPVGIDWLEGMIERYKT